MNYDRWFDRDYLPPIEETPIEPGTLRDPYPGHMTCASPSCHRIRGRLWAMTGVCQGCSGHLDYCDRGITGSGEVFGSDIDRRLIEQADASRTEEP